MNDFDYAHMTPDASDDTEERRRIWRAYLGGREPCRTCDGSGYNPRDRADHAHASAHCPTCKGTGE